MIYSDSITTNAVNHLYNESSSSLDEQLLSSFEKGDFSLAASLIRQGADCEQLTRLPKPLFIDVFKETMSFSKEDDNKIPNLGEIDPIEMIGVFLQEVLEEDLSYNPAKISDFIRAHHLDEEFQEGLDIFLPFIAFMQNLPLPIVAILQGQEDIVDAILERGINIYTLKSEYTMPEAIQSQLELPGYFTEPVTITLSEMHQVIRIALQSKNLKAVDLFLKFGVDPVEVYKLNPDIYDSALQAGHYEVAKACFDYKQKLEAEEQRLKELKHWNDYLEKSQKIIDEGGTPSSYFPPLNFLASFASRDSSMMYAAEGGNLQILQMLLDSGRKATERPMMVSFEYTSPLGEALKYGHVEAAQLLIDQGATFDVSLQDTDSCEIFKQLARYGNPETLKFLLDLGCATSFVENDNTYNLLEFAVIARNEANIRFALSLGYDTKEALGALFQTDYSAQLKWGFVQPTKSFSPLTDIEMIDLFLEHGADLSNNEVFERLLFLGKEEEFDHLIEHGVRFPEIKSLDLRAKIGLLYSAIDGESIYLFDKLLGYGLDVQSIMAAEDYFCGAFMQIAAGCESPDFVKKIVLLGGDYHVLDSENGSNLLFAVCSGEVAQFLIDQGLDVNQRNIYGETPLFEAHGDVVDVLVRNGAQVNVQNYIGETPLFDEYIGSKRIHKLIEKGVNPNHLNFEGQTALMKHCLESNLYRVEDLLEAGIDPTFKNRDGKTALDLVLEAHKDKIEQKSFWSGYSDLKDILKLLGYEKPASV